jgi:hypothetical protein
MQPTPSVTVRSIAFLDTFCKEHGIPSTQSITVAEGGVTARTLAESIGLPTERIEGIFHNYSKSGLDVLVMPGDRVAFVPYGTPASHPAFFGAFTTAN